MTPMDKVPYANLISEESGEFLRWPGDIMHEYGHMISGLLYSRLFMPSFLEVEGSILLDKDHPGTAAAFLKGKAGGEFSLAKLEASFNTIEPYYLFSDRDHYSEATEIKFTNALAEALRAWLRHRYPSRLFAVVVNDPDVTKDMYSVEFYEVRDEAAGG